MRKNMAPKKKHKKNSKVISKKALNSRRKKSNDLIPIFTKVISAILAKPFSLINLFINKSLVIIKNIFLQLFILIKRIFNLLSGVKEAF